MKHEYLAERQGLAWPGLAALTLYMADKRGWPWPALGLSSALHEAAYVI
jgi:hypothetical protein